MVSVVSLNEIHPDSQVFLGECSSRHRIIDHHIRQLENERILSDSILIVGHLKRWFDNTSYTADGTETSAILLQLRKPLLRIRYFDGADFAAAEIFFLDQIQNKLITDLSAVTNAFLQADVLFQQFNNCDLSCFIVNASVKLLLNFLLFLTKFLQGRGINTLSFPSAICVPVLIDPVLSLAFSCFQDTAFMIFPFFAQFRSPFFQKESRCDTYIVSHQALFFYYGSEDIRWKTPVR